MRHRIMFLLTANLLAMNIENNESIFWCVTFLFASSDPRLCLYLSRRS